MSSLLQHHGTMNARGVELLMYLQKTETFHSCDTCGAEQPAENTVCSGCQKQFAQRFIGSGDDRRMEVLIPYEDRPIGSSAREVSLCQRSRTFDVEPVTLRRPNGTETVCPKLYRIFRKPAGMFGCWVVFRWGGKEHVPDLSVPIGVDTLPRDAREVPEPEACAYWFASR